MHLRYDIMRADMGSNFSRHPVATMKELGISYQHATPQSMADQWWFWNCTGVPEVLPDYLSDLELDPQECVGFGLSQEDADKIVKAGGGMALSAQETVRAKQAAIDIKDFLLAHEADIALEVADFGTLAEAFELIHGRRAEG